MRNPFDFSEIAREGLERIKKTDPDEVARDMAPVTITMPRKMAEFLKDDLEGMFSFMEMTVDLMSGIKNEDFRQALEPIKEGLPAKSLMVTLYAAAIKAALAKQEREAPKESAKN